MSAFRSDRTWCFDEEPDELWAAIVRTDRYPVWWPWLRHFDDGEGFLQGASWRCVVAPPLPYVVRFDVHLEQVEEGRAVTSRVSGDISGTAVLTIADGGGTTEARLVSSLRPANPVLQSFGLVARPLVEWGHDWVLDHGRRQFVDRALQGTP